MENVRFHFLQKVIGKEKIMKKRLVLLPIFGALALAGCSVEDLMFWKKNSSNSDQQQEQKPSGGDVVPDEGGSSGGKTSATVYTPDEPEAPAGMSLIGAVKGVDMKDLAFKGYDACKGDHTTGGFTVNFNGAVQINGDVASLKNNTNLYVIQFAKKGHEKAAEGGTLTVKNVQPKKVIVQAFLKSSYSWGANQLGTVTMGGEAVSVPKQSTKTTTEYSSDYAIHTVTLDVNASEAGDFAINDSNNFAIYIAYIGFFG